MLPGLILFRRFVVWLFGGVRGDDGGFGDGVGDVSVEGASEEVVERHVFFGGLAGGCVEGGHGVLLDVDGGVVAEACFLVDLRQLISLNHCVEVLVTTVSNLILKCEISRQWRSVLHFLNRIMRTCHFLLILKHAILVRSLRNPDVQLNQIIKVFTLFISQLFRQLLKLPLNIPHLPHFLPHNLSIHVLRCMAQITRLIYSFRAFWEDIVPLLLVFFVFLRRLDGVILLFHGAAEAGRRL